MKSKLKLFLFAFVTVLLLAACGNETTNNIKENEKDTITKKDTLILYNEDDTKQTLEEDTVENIPLVEKQPLAEFVKNDNHFIKSKNLQKYLSNKNHPLANNITADITREEAKALINQDDLIQVEDYYNGGFCSFYNDFAICSDIDNNTSAILLFDKMPFNTAKEIFNMEINATELEYDDYSQGYVYFTKIEGQEYFLIFDSNKEDAVIKELLVKHIYE